MNSQELQKLTSDILSDSKAIDLINIDVRQLTDVTDSMIICSGTSKRHVKGMADKVLDAVKANGERPLGMEGEDESEWILIDLGDVVVHIMTPETRTLYSLEKLWTTVSQHREANAD